MLTKDQIKDAGKAGDLWNDKVQIPGKVMEALACMALAWLAVQPRPIEEAPKDGTVVWTDDGPDKWRRTVFVSAQETARELRLDLSVTLVADVWASPDDHSNNWEPTHFLPLSALPNPGAGAPVGG